MSVRSAVSSASDTTDNLALFRRLAHDAEEQTPFGCALKHSMAILRDAFRLYGPERVVSSFNGGKDAVVILHLSLAVLAAYNDESGRDERLRVIFFETDDEFPEIDAFVRETVARSRLELVTSAEGFVQGLSHCIAEHNSAAFILGTRAADPNAAGQQDFAPSSDWMPPFMRVNPILTWSYADVWTFLRTYELPYCALYDDGYTSLGKVASTERNPALRRDDGTYAPAWQLRDESLERAGRVSSKKAAAPAPAADAPTAAAAADQRAEGEPRVPTARMRASSAALLIVGDEILGGKQQDGNTYAAAQRLRQAGVTLKRVCIVADDIDEIVTELGRLRSSVDVVLTSGGLGPTHDDITLKGVAQALGANMEHSEEMAAIIELKYAQLDKTLAPAILNKMSTLPAGVRIRSVASDPTAWPILQCANVFVLPGVPAFFAAKLETICDEYLEPAQPPVLSRCVRLRVPEELIVSALNGVVAAYPDVAFGSYPVHQGDVLTVITLEAAGGAGAGSIKAALAALLADMPEGSVVEVTTSSSLAQGGTADSS